MKVDRMGPMSRREKREQLQFFIEHPSFHHENFVWKSPPPRKKSGNFSKSF